MDIELMKIVLEHKYIIIGLITSIIGASARISYEKEAKHINKIKVRSYYTAALFVGYLFYEFLQYINYTKLTAIACLLGGLISVEIIKILVEVLPGIFKKKLGTYSSSKDIEDE